MGKRFVLIAVNVLGSVWADIVREGEMARFYTELGCTPVARADNSTLCPDAFDCSKLHPDPTKCYYRGVPYSDGSTIPQNLISNPCLIECQCRAADGPRFECATVDCQLVKDEYKDQGQCVSIYDLDSCCKHGNVCGNDEIANLKTCEVDGATYREGERFNIKNTHKICVCTGAWDGATDAAYCRDLNCDIEIRFQEEILLNCAPVFVGNKRSCPFMFTCPTASSKVVRGLNVRGVSGQCQFGNTTLSVGDEVTVEDKCTTCACDVPPFVSCTRNNSCY